jgi:isoleucyl-tRNA synthetase
MPGANDNSIFLETWYEDLAGGYNNQSIEVARDINTHIRKQLEEMRRDKIIGSSLDAEIDIYCDEATFKALNELGDELRFVFITSGARVHQYADKPSNALEIGESLAILVNKSAHQKCVRCWHHREDVAQNDDHPELCGRCALNVAGEGEKRVFA